MVNKSLGFRLMAARADAKRGKINDYLQYNQISDASVCVFKSGFADCLCKKAFSFISKRAVAFTSKRPFVFI